MAAWQRLDGSQNIGKDARDGGFTGSRITQKEEMVCYFTFGVAAFQFMFIVYLIDNFLYGGFYLVNAYKLIEFSHDIIVGFFLELFACDIICFESRCVKVALYSLLPYLFGFFYGKMAVIAKQEILMLIAESVLENAFEFGSGIIAGF